MKLVKQVAEAAEAKKEKDAGVRCYHTHYRYCYFKHCVCMCVVTRGVHRQATRASRDIGWDACVYRSASPHAWSGGAKLPDCVWWLSALPERNPHAWVGCRLRLSDHTVRDWAHLHLLGASGFAALLTYHLCLVSPLQASPARTAAAATSSSTCAR